MNSIVVISESGTTRREMCFDCTHCRTAQVPKAGVKVVLSSEDIDELPTCVLKYQMTCQLRAALSDKQATCPHPDTETALRWNVAQCDSRGGCEQGEQSHSYADTGQPSTPANMTASQGPIQRGTAVSPYRVYNGTRYIYD